jgi:hypothetical protein
MCTFQAGQRRIICVIFLAQTQRLREYNSMKDDGTDAFKNGQYEVALTHYNRALEV